MAEERANARWGPIPAVLILAVLGLLLPGVLNLGSGDRAASRAPSTGAAPPAATKQEESAPRPESELWRLIGESAAIDADEIDNPGALCEFVERCTARNIRLRFLLA